MEGIASVVNLTTLIQNESEPCCPWLECPEIVRSGDTSAGAAREALSRSTEYVPQSPSAPKPPTTFTGRQVFQQCSSLALFS